MPSPPSPRALFAVSSLGLGHATRSLAVIFHYLEKGWSITVLSSGTALQFLRNELADSPKVDFLERADYPPLERGSGWRLYWYLLLDLLSTWRMIGREHRELRGIGSRYDFIFSDGRYGAYSNVTPCFILTHQIAFMPPRLLRPAFRLTERLNLLALRKFDAILIPDYPESQANLSGQLSHSGPLAGSSHSYVGILSSYRRLELEPDIDYLFVISGYLREHKESFICALIRQAALLPGKKVFVLGQQEAVAVSAAITGNPELEIHPMVDGARRQNLFNRARTVISRAGYTTIMDLVEHDKRGVLIPTPNQTEQEYLARHLHDRRHFVTARQSEDFDLAAALAGCPATRLFEPPWRTAESLAKIHSCIESRLHRRYISIIVPAHNEEKELAASLATLLAQDYPADRYEIIVVENGSTDATAQIARAVAGSAAAAGKIRVLQSRRGVSQAKNTGLAHTAAESEWVVFCDADTHLEPLFLRQLNTWLHRSPSSFSVGTCSIRPRPAEGFYCRFWFRLYDWIHRLTRTSYGLQIADTAVARRVGFDSELELAEDLLFIKGCRTFGHFFFLTTDQVSTSIRRFEAVGYLRLSLRWSIEALLPMRYKRNRRYRVIR